MNQIEKIEKYKENYYALAIAVCTKKSVSESLMEMDIKSNYNTGEKWVPSRKRRGIIIERDWLKARLDEGLVYNDIANLAKCSTSKIKSSVHEYGLKRRPGWRKRGKVEYVNEV